MDIFIINLYSILKESKKDDIMLINIIYNERLSSIPKILETPYIGDTDDSKERLYPPYKFEIEMIRNKNFNPEFLNMIREYYKNN